MNDLSINQITITNIKVDALLKDYNESIKANVELELNGCMTIRGIQIIKGQFGHFIQLPTDICDCISTDATITITNATLKAYAKELALTLPAIGRKREAV